MRILFILAIVLGSIPSIGFTQSTNSDKEYVWARSGLNVRSGPGTNFDIIEKLEFGDSITVLSETEIPYNVTGMSKVSNRQQYYSRKTTIGPYLLYGNWLEIYTQSGKIGYVISQYIIDIKPNITNEECPFEEVSRDTISVYDEIESFELSVKLKFKDGIEGSLYGNKGCYGEMFYLPNYTIQEAFVMILNNTNSVNINRLSVEKNWPNELVLGDGYYSISFIIKEDGVYYSMMGCC